MVGTDNCFKNIMGCVVFSKSTSQWDRLSSDICISKFSQLKPLFAFGLKSRCEYIVRRNISDSPIIMSTARPSSGFLPSFSTKLLAIYHKCKAANNCRSSDIGRPKFAHVRRNHKCGGTWCPDKYFIVNHFTATMNKNLPWLSRTTLVMSDHNFVLSGQDGVFEKNGVRWKKLFAALQMPFSNWLHYSLSVL